MMINNNKANKRKKAIEQKCNKVTEKCDIEESKYKFEKLLEQCCKQQERLCNGMKCRIMVGGGIVFLFVVLAVLSVFLVLKEAWSDSNTDQVLVLIILALIAGFLAVVAFVIHQIPLSFFEKNFSTFQEDKQLLLMVSMVTILGKADEKEAKEMYARIIESELRRREQLVYLQKRKSNDDK